jgi:hypothetical protein
MGTEFLKPARRRIAAALVAGAAVVASLPAAAGIISLNFTSTVDLGGVATGVEGNFLLDTTFALMDGFNDGAVVGGSVTVGDVTSGSPDPDSLFTTLFFQDTAPGVTGLSVEADDGVNFWSISMFIGGQTSAEGLYDFLLSGITEDDFVPGLFDPLLVLDLATTPFLTSGIDSFSVTMVSVPEPGTVALMGVGVLMWFGRRRFV